MVVVQCSDRKGHAGGVRRVQFETILEDVLQAVVVWISIPSCIGAGQTIAGQPGGTRIGQRRRADFEVIHQRGFSLIGINARPEADLGRSEGGNDISAWQLGEVHAVGAVKAGIDVVGDAQAQEKRTSTKVSAVIRVSVGTGARLH